MTEPQLLDRNTIDDQQVAAVKAALACLRYDAAANAVIDNQIANLKVAKHIVRSQPEAFEPWTTRSLVAGSATTRSRRRGLDRLTDALRRLPLLLH